jgi:hypothetical protein
VSNVHQDSGPSAEAVDLSTIDDWLIVVVINRRPRLTIEARHIDALNESPELLLKCRKVIYEAAVSCFRLLKIRFDLISLGNGSGETLPQPIQSLKQAKVVPHVPRVGCKP